MQAGRLGYAFWAVLVGILTIAMYMWITAWSVIGVMPVFALLGLLTLPLAVKAIKGALNYDEEAKFLPALGANLVVVLGTQALVGIGYTIATLV